MTMRLAIAVLAALAMACFALPQPADAAYPCPGGPGPGEVQVGVSGGTHGVAAVPVCDRVGGGGGDGGGGGGVYYIYGSVAWHPDADDVWMVGRQPGTLYAEAEALDECNRAMGGGCSSIGEWHNSSMTIIRDNQGVLYNGWNGQGGAGRKRVLAECSIQQLLPCEILHSFGSDKRRHSPAPGARKLYASAAWIFGKGFDGRLYIASGHRDVAAADQAALGACGAATGRTCQLATFVGNGLIQPYKANTEPSVLVERTAKRAAQAAQIYCKRKRSKCSLQRSYDSRTPGNFVHDYNPPSTDPSPP